MKDAPYKEAENRVKLAAYFAKEMIETLGKDKASVSPELRPIVCASSQFLDVPIVRFYSVTAGYCG